MGTILQHQGLRTGRLDKGGRGIYLLGPECALIHDRARAYEIPTLRQGLSGCPHCYPQKVRNAHDAHNEPDFEEEEARQDEAE